MTANNSRMCRAILFTFTITLSSFPADAKYSGGTGDLNDPYQITTAEDLMLLGETPEDYDKQFILTADIDLDPNLPGRKVFDKAVIAADTDPVKYSFQGTPFTGIFDGNGHIILHLRIAGEDYVGLFGQLGDSHTSGGQVRDLGLVDINITGSGDHVGGLAGYNLGSVVIRCYSTGVVSGTYILGSAVGGLVGENNHNWITWCGLVTHCYSTCSVSGKWSFIGGLVGSNSGDVTHSYSTGAVSGYWIGELGRDLVGGLVGGFSPVGVMHSVWDTETSGQSGSAGGAGLTTAGMMDVDMLGLNGFANDPNWVLDAGRDYPRLAWEGTPGGIVPEPDTDWLEGRGTPEDPYRIDTPEQLILLSKASILWNRHFVLDADIDLDLNRLGRYVFSQAVIPRFEGVFDGNDHTISHLTIDGGSYLGLFGALVRGAEVRNLGLVDLNITGFGHIGGLAGGNGWLSSVTNCYSTGKVSGHFEAGGLVGTNGGTVTQCYSTGAVQGGDCVGGLVSSNSVDGDLTHSYSTGAVTGDTRVGGLVGDNSYGSIAASYSTGAVLGGDCVGGLVGFISYGSGSIATSYSTGAVSGTGYEVGGFVGSHSDDSLIPRGEPPQLGIGCFWDIETSGQLTSAGGVGKTTAQMQTAATFLDAEWDFVGETANGTEDLWWILEGKDYPRLWWER